MLLFDEFIPYYNRGGVNRLAHLNNKAYILRVYRHQWRKLHEINFEIDILNHLKNKGLHVSYPIQKTNMEYLTELNAPEGLRYTLLTTCALGKEPTYRNIDDASSYGMHVAKLHNYSENFTSNFTKQNLDMSYLLYNSIKTINTFMKSYPKHKKYFQNFIEKLLSKIKYLPMENLNYGFCHGDLYGGNAHKHLDNIEFFDFDFCGFGWRSYDISVFRWGCRSRNQEDKLWNAYIDGYKSIRKISDLDLEWTTYFLIIRDLWAMALYIKNSKEFGSVWLGDFYIEKRMKFLKKFEEDYL